MGNTSALNERRPKLMICLLFWNGSASRQQQLDGHPSVPPLPQRMRLADTCLYFCAVFGMCFEKMRTNLVSSLDVRSNSSDVIVSISSRCASNTADQSRVPPLQRSAKSPSAALLIWHCTICSPFLIVNLNAIRSASYPTASPRVSGMNAVPFQGSVKAGRDVGPSATHQCCSPL